MSAAGDDAQRTADLSKLQNEYRHMEQNRRAYAEESQQMLRKQQITIEKLRKENDSLKTELAIEFRQSRKPADPGLTSRLTKLQDQADWYTKQIELEEGQMRVMSEQVALMRQKVLHQRKIMGGVNAAKENEQMVQKQVRILENRLDKALTKFNESLCHNKLLRAEIDDLRRERLVFDGIYRKLERDLAEKKRQMASIIELSNLSYEQRDNSQIEIAAIEQANRREENEFASQMMELTRQAEEEHHPTGTGGGRSTAAHTEMLSKEAGATALKHKQSKIWSPSKDKINTQNSMERIQNFEEAFSRIKAATGISDVEELVETFIKNEDKNFSLFNYVNEQQNEIEKLEEHQQALRLEELKHAQESGDDVHQHKQALRELEARLQATEAAAEKYEARCAESTATLDQLKSGVQSTLINVFGADALPDGLGDGTGSVTESNIMGCLGMIEAKANELLQLYARVQEADRALVSAEAALDEEGGAGTLRAQQPGGAIVPAGGDAATATVLGVGPQTPMGQELLHVTPPKLEDYSSDEEGQSEDEDERPLTHDELKSRAVNSMQRRSNGKDAARGGKRGVRK